MLCGMKNVFQGGERRLIASSDMAQEEKAMRDVLLSLWDFFPYCSAGSKPATEQDFSK